MLNICYIALSTFADFYLGSEPTNYIFRLSWNKQKIRKSKLEVEVVYIIMYFSFQRDVITIWFTLTGSSDIWNWVCLFLCLVLASFGTFCSKFQVKWNIKMRNRHKFDNCLMTVCSVLLLGIDTEVL